MSGVKRKRMKEVDDIASKIYKKENIEWSQALKKAWKIYNDDHKPRKRYSKKTNSQRKRDRSTERKRRSTERKKINEKYKRKN